MFNVLHCFTFVQCLICILFSPAWSPTVGTVFIEFVVSLYVEVTSAKWFNVLGLGFKRRLPKFSATVHLPSVTVTESMHKLMKLT